MTISNNIILDHTQIQQKIRRIAYQIYESNINETEIILAGIAQNGYILAQKLAETLTEISSMQVKLCEVHINKKEPLTPIQTSFSKEDCEGKSLVLVDDVLNSGTTLIYGVKHFLEVPLKRFKTAVLVNRNHKKYPVKADFKGISLSTSIQEHVVVEFREHETVAYLM